MLGLFYKTLFLVQTLTDCNPSSIALAPVIRLSNLLIRSEASMESRI